MILTKHDGVCGYGMKENSGDIIHLHALETILFTVSGNFSKWESYFVHKIFSAMGVCLFVFFGGSEPPQIPMSFPFQTLNFLSPKLYTAVKKIYLGSNSCRPATLDGCLFQLYQGTK